MSITRERKINEEVIIRWTWIIWNRMFSLFGISRASFGPKVDKVTYFSMDDQNETSVDIEIHAYSSGES